MPDQCDGRWGQLLDAFVPDDTEEWFFGYMGSVIIGDSWRVRTESRKILRLPRSDASLLALTEEIGASGLADLVDPFDVERELIRHAASAAATKAGGVISWAEARDSIRRSLSLGVAAVAVGGVVATPLNPADPAEIVEIGPRSVAGHLDTGLERAVAQLARRSGLPGFSFSDESWWTEEFMGAKEDEDLVPEILDGYADNGGWPWLVIATSVPASGYAAEAAARFVVESLLGALCLLDHVPGTSWFEAPPWIAGGLTLMENPRDPSDRGGDGTLPVAAQRVDARLYHLESADSDERSGPRSTAIDLGAHLRGPAAGLLARVAEEARNTETPAPIANACNLAWHAVASRSSVVRSALTQKALSLVTAEDPRDAESLTATGKAWREQVDSAWPRPRAYFEEPDFDDWATEDAKRISYGSLTGGEDPAWSIRAIAESLGSLDHLQAAVLGAWQGADS